MCLKLPSCSPRLQPPALPALHPLQARPQPHHLLPRPSPRRMEVEYNLVNMARGSFSISINSWAVAWQCQGLSHDWPLGWQCQQLVVEQCVWLPYNSWKLSKNPRLLCVTFNGWARGAIPSTIIINIQLLILIINSWAIEVFHSISTLTPFQ